MDWSTLGPLLMHIQARLDEDLGLAALARKAGYSPFHLQRAFRAFVGETPKAYVERLRLERAAVRLWLQGGNILGVALDCGFRTAEGFLRAFRRRFGVTPSTYRRRRGARRPEDPAPNSRARGDAADRLPGTGELSATNVRRLRPLHVAYRRHVGPYESVPESIFDELEAWRIRARLPGPPIWLGIGHDAPGITPPDRLRFDAALVVPKPFAPNGLIGHQRLEGGDFAVTTHVGPYSTLPAAYAAVFPRVVSLRGWQLVGLPAVEFYATTRVNLRHALPHTEIWLPVRRVRPLRE